MVIKVDKMMKSLKNNWAITMFVLFIIIGCRQNMDSSETESTRVVMEEQPGSMTIDDVARAVSTFNEAMVNPSAELMENLCADQLTYGHSSGLIQNKAAFIDDLVNGPFDFLTLEAADQTITISGNTAIVRHIFMAKGTNAGEPVDVRIGNVQVYQKEGDGKLRLLARQAYKLPN
jgi:ketosteroid isomerase-like protein